jgi:uncharacterized protein
VSAEPPLLRRADGGFLIKVKAHPGAPRTCVTGILGDAFKISVHAAPERGRANDEIVRFLAEELGVAKEAVVLRSGAASRQKVFWVKARDGADMLAALTAGLKRG